MANSKKYTVFGLYTILVYLLYYELVSLIVKQ